MNKKYIDCQVKKYVQCMIQLGLDHSEAHKLGESFRSQLENRNV